jgi:hypothetical protein
VDAEGCFQALFGVAMVALIAVIAVAMVLVA